MRTLAPSHDRGNGQAEAFNKEIISKLRVVAVPDMGSSPPALSVCLQQHAALSTQVYPLLSSLDFTLHH